MRQLPAVFAEGGVHFPPSVEEFFLPGVGGQPWISKITVLLWTGTPLFLQRGCWGAGAGAPRCARAGGQQFGEDLGRVSVGEAFVRYASGKECAE